MFIQTAKGQDDDWGRQAIGRLQGAYDLFAEEASHHRACLSAFRSNRLRDGGGRIEDLKKQSLFCEWFENELEYQVFTLEELCTKMLDDF